MEEFLKGYRLIWSPWRSTYIKGFTEKHKHDKCLFCLLPKMDDEEAYIIHRGKHAYVVLNAYPYNSGHLMIVPYRHISSVVDISDEEAKEIMRLVKRSLKVLEEAFRPDGFNIGVNIGRAAGAGIEEHVHVHVVPRWIGDANFMPIIGNAKPLPISLKEVYEVVKSLWEKR